MEEGDVVLVWKLDRPGRSVAHLADLVTRLGNDGIHICFASEGINTTTTGGRIMFHIMAAMAASRSFKT